MSASRRVGDIRKWTEVTAIERAERDYIIDELTKGRAIENATSYRSGQPIERVNRYVTDGEMTLANLAGGA